MVNTIKANYVDVIKRQIYFAELKFGKTIMEITKLSDTMSPGEPFAMPGFVDAHVHIESSMLTPQYFASMVIPHGTMGVVCDPHEIANVLGSDGVEFMMDDAAKSPLKFFFAIPSCVPSTPFETNGAEFGPRQIQRLMPRGVALAEMMNYPGVLASDPDVIKKIDIAKKANRPIDGHIPGIVDDRLEKYVAAGISTDHESYELSEAERKIQLGMKILIREGSAARNLDALFPLFFSHPDDIMVCTDDAHPDDIRARGHIDKFYRYARSRGVDLFEIFKVLLLNPVSHYKLNVGRLQIGDRADFIVVNSLDDLDIRKVFIEGKLVSDGGSVCFSPGHAHKINKFVSRTFSDDDFRVISPSLNPSVRVLGLVPSQLVSENLVWATSAAPGDEITADVASDTMKISVVNRYALAPVVNAFIRGTGLKGGAMASSIAHDSHNVVVIGSSADLMRKAAETVFASKGGIAVVSPRGDVASLKLPIAGLMVGRDWNAVADKYESLVLKAHRWTSTSLQSPFMTMAFMSLVVIPSLKVSDRGLFDADKFQFTSLFV